MEGVQWWLLFVAFLRSISVVVGYVGPSSFQRSLFTTSASQVTPLAARTFSIWTSITCTLCVVCASHLQERGIVLATAASFYAAAFYFTAELLIFRTVTLRDWGIVISFIVAGQPHLPLIPLTRSHHCQPSLPSSALRLVSVLCALSVACRCVRVLADIHPLDAAQSAVVKRKGGGRGGDRLQLLTQRPHPPHTTLRLHAIGCAGALQPPCAFHQTVHYTTSAELKCASLSPAMLCSGTPPR